jgi:hypothetical protein
LSTISKIESSTSIRLHGQLVQRHLLKDRWVGACYIDLTILEKLGCTKKRKKALIRRYDTQHNDIQPDDTQHNKIQHNDTQHNMYVIATLSITTLSIMALNFVMLIVYPECHN